MTWFREMPKRFWQVLVAVLVIGVLIVAASMVYTKATTKTFTAYFTSAVSIYKGDPVRVLGVNVGSIADITPRDGDVKVTISVDKDVQIPASAKAIQVAQSLVSGRFIQLAPVYSSGPELADGADIPMDRTAVPVEWDQVKTQLDRLTKAVGPDGASKGSAAQAIDVADDNLSGNGVAVKNSLKQLSDVMSSLSNGRSNLMGTVQNLQKLTDALSNSRESLVQFNGRLASVSSVLAENNNGLNDALKGLDGAMGDIQKFLDTNKSGLTDSVKRLQDVAQVMDKNDKAVREILHSAPNQVASFYNIYYPLQGSLTGQFALSNGHNMIDFICSSIAGAARPGTQGDAKACVDILGPILAQVVLNYPPIATNPMNGSNARPDQIFYQNADVARRAKQRVAAQDDPGSKGDRLLSRIAPFAGGGK